VRQYLSRRVAAFVATLFVVSLLVFVVIRVLPGDPAQVIMGTEGNPEATARLRTSLGLDRPLVVQYVDWLAHAVRGDLGVSIQYDVPVGRLIMSRLPVTLPLTLLAAAFMVATAVPLGLYAATHHRRVGDYVTMVISQLGISVPSFWAGLLLILAFSVHLGWTQSGGFRGWRSLILPAIALGVFQAAVLVRATRSAVLDVMREDYVRTARAKGVPEGVVVVKHTLRLESVFVLPGLGRLALGAITARDLPVVQGVTLFVASSIVAINFLVDLAYSALDPRLRHE